MLYVDIPTRSELDTLLAARSDASVSIVLATTAQTQGTDKARIQLGNLLKQATEQLEAVGVDKRTIAAIEEQVHDLQDDDEFWQFQANSLVLYVTPASLRSFRLPTHLEDMVQVSDRFHIKPLLRATSVGQHAFVLALEENAVRLIEVTGDLPPEEIRVPDMPKDAASFAGTANVNSRSYAQRKGGSEGQKVLLRAYARRIDAVLRPVLSGRSEPLIIAATEPMNSIFRSVCSFGGLAEHGIATSPATMTPGELAAAARPILDTIHAELLDDVRATFSARENEGRATKQIADAARAATFGAVETLLIDMDEALAGLVDQESGAVTFDDAASAASYGIVDEIAARVLQSGGTVYAVRSEDIPGNGSLAAILRYAV
ncbi:MAG: baeRF11 domain-containing protein [Erythrobacter sp.]